MARIEQKLQAAQKEFDGAVAKLAEAEAAQNEDDAGEALTNELKQVTEKIKQITSQMSDARVSVMVM